jgi:hypothetical protein
MKTLIKLSAILFLLIGTTSCFMEGVKGDGNVVTKKRKISDDFSRVEVSRGLDVYLTKSKDVSLEVEADENLHELIQTEVKGGVLKITSSKNIWSARAKKVHLHVDNLSDIRINSGADLRTRNTFVSDELRLSISSGASAEMELNVEDLTCDISSGADIRLSGEAENFTVSSSSGSDVKAYELNARNCRADASSGSDIKLKATETIDARATSGADIRYKGNPRVIEKEDNSGGSVRSAEV